jgi:hypothetical protein
MRCVPARDFSVGKSALWRGAIYDDPPYQRESTVWPVAKQQRFIDSLLNGFDVPKIYLHDLRGQHPTRVYAVIDGKQRLNTIWRFLDDALALADDFRIEPANMPDIPAGIAPPPAGARFSDLAPAWQKALTRTPLSVVLVQDATEEDIEDLFSRLNSGEPLNAAEKRNARGGDMAALVRLVARRPFIADRLGWAHTRYRHLELASRLLLLEQADRVMGPLPDLGGRALDTFVDSNRLLAPAERDDLIARVDAGLGRLERIFREDDPLLAGQPPVPVYYLFAREVARAGSIGSRVGDGSEALDGYRSFLERFQKARLNAREQPNGEPDATLAEYTQLGAHRPTEAASLARRLEILLDRFRAAAPVTAR